MMARRIVAVLALAALAAARDLEELSEELSHELSEPRRYALFEEFSKQLAEIEAGPLPDDLSEELSLSAPQRKVLFGSTGGDRQSYSNRNRIRDRINKRMDELGFEEGGLLTEIITLTNAKLDDMYANFCRLFKRSECEEERKPYFKKCLGRIASSNRRAFNKGANRKHGITNLCDRSDEELRALNGLTQAPPQDRRARALNSISAPDVDSVAILTIDWRDGVAGFPAGVSMVTPVKDQGSCGSCWAFSACAALESFHAITGSEDAPDCSEEELKDCTYWDYSGCNGGWMSTAFDYVRGQNGVLPEESMRYHTCDNHEDARRQLQWQDTDKICTGNSVLDAGSAYKYDRCQVKSDVQYTRIANIGGSYAIGTDIGSIDWRKAIQLGPFSQAFMHVSYDWFSYIDGVMELDFCTGTESVGGHAVTAVAYNKDTDVFTFKNSWGSWWGNGGYFEAKIGACSSTGHSYYSQGLVTEMAYSQSDVESPPPSPPPRADEWREKFWTFIGGVLTAIKDWQANKY